jgi:hypothetical protein
MVEGFLLRPDPAQEAHYFPGPGVTITLRDKVAFPALVGFVAAGDEVHGDAPTAAELVEGGGLTGQEGRGHEPRPMGDQYLQPAGGVQHRGGDGPPFGSDGAVADEHPVKPPVVVGPGDSRQVVGVHHRTVGPVDDRTVDQRALDLRGVPRPHHSDDLDWHPGPFVSREDTATMTGSPTL